MTFGWLVVWLASSAPPVRHAWLVGLLVCAFIDLVHSA